MSTSTSTAHDLKCVDFRKGYEIFESSAQDLICKPLEGVCVCVCAHAPIWPHPKASIRERWHGKVQIQASL